MSALSLHHAVAKISISYAGSRKRHSHKSSDIVPGSKVKDRVLLVRLLLFLQLTQQHIEQVRVLDHNGHLVKHLLKCQASLTQAVLRIIHHAAVLIKCLLTSLLNAVE